MHAKTADFSNAKVYVLRPGPEIGPSTMSLPVHARVMVTRCSRVLLITATETLMRPLLMAFAKLSGKLMQVLQTHTRK